MSHPAFVFVVEGASVCTRARAIGGEEKRSGRRHLTRRPAYHRDKLSRHAPPSELSERHSLCLIRGLAKCGRLAHVLLRRLAKD
jgi:hypothetical protein